MASYNELNALIDAYINRNGVQAITGQILNGVLKAMVEQLGRGYTIMGAAIPTTDPGTPDGPECYFASETGTYTDFDGLQIVPGELALLCYTPTDGWTKETIYEGFQEVEATIDGNVGTPSVGVSYANGVLSFDFHNMKGNPGQNGQDGQDGDPAGFGTIGADITGGVGTPGVTVESSGPATAKNLQFHFTNLKGETGVTSVVATVDNTTGTPTCTVSLVGQQLTLAFSGLKGAQGNTGSSVDYPFTIVNNLTTDDATQALSAAQGKVLDGKVSQLEAELNGIVPFPYTVTKGREYDAGGYTSWNRYSCTDILSAGTFNFKCPDGFWYTLSKYVSDTQGVLIYGYNSITRENITIDGGWIMSVKKQDGTELTTADIDTINDYGMISEITGNDLQTMREDISELQEGVEGLSGQIVGLSNDIDSIEEEIDIIQDELNGYYNPEEQKYEFTNGVPNYQTFQNTLSEGKPYIAEASVGQTWSRFGFSKTNSVHDIADTNNVLLIVVTKANATVEFIAPSKETYPYVFAGVPVSTDSIVIKSKETKDDGIISKVADFEGEKYIIDTEKPYNLLRPDNYTLHSLVLAEDGRVVTNPSWDYCTSDYLEIDPAKEYVCNFPVVRTIKWNESAQTHQITQNYCFERINYAFYDKDKVFTPSESALQDNSKKIPANAKYIRVSLTSSAYIPIARLIYGNYVDSPLLRVVEYKKTQPQKFLRPNSTFEGLNMVMFGDSITHGDLGYAEGNAGVSFVDYANDYIGSNIINVGFGGTRMAPVEGYPSSAFAFSNLIDAIIDNDWTALDAYALENPTYADHLSTLKAVDWSNIHAIGIMYGANDFMSSTPIGTDYNTIVTNYDGACAYGLDRLLTKYPHLQVILFTPMYRQPAGLGILTSDTDNAPNGIGKYMTDYGESLKNVQKIVHCPVVDMYHESNLNRYSMKVYSLDGTHPRCDLGQERLGRLFAEAIMRYIVPVNILN